MNELTTEPLQFTDESGEIITFDDVDKARARAAFLEQQIAINVTQMSFALKEMRDSKFYLLRGCDSFSEYCQNIIQLSRGQAYRYITLATAFNENTLQNLSSGGLSFKKLLDLSKETEVVDGLNAAEIEGDKVVYEDGTSESLQDVIARVKNKAKKENADALQKQKNLVDLKTEHINKIEEQKREKDEEISELKQGIENLSKMKDVDVSRLNYIKSQDEAAMLIDEVMAETGQQLGSICKILPELIDARLASKFAAMMASVEAALGNIREQYGDQVLFADAPRPDGFLPD